MAAEAVALARRVSERRTPVVLDLCCGAGAVGLAVATEVPGTELWAVDLEPSAVACARRNVGDRGRVLQGDLDAPLPSALRGRVDVLVANVPYVPTDDIALLPAESRLHEPRVALDGGADGLRVLSRVAALALRWLAPGGSVLCETSEPQAAEAADSFERNGLVSRLVADADLGATVVVGTRGSGAGSGTGYPSRDTATS
jgi:release factor glutamine methyltransferase